MMKSFSHIIHTDVHILSAGLSLFLMAESCVFESYNDDSVETLDITIVQKLEQTKAISVEEKEQNVQSVRAACFWSENLNMSNKYFASHKYLISTLNHSYKITIPDVPLGGKYLLIMANEPDAVTPLLNSIDSAPDATSVQLDLNEVNADSDTLLPMFSYQEIMVERGTKVNASLIRSVAKVELHLYQSSDLLDEGIVVKIPAGSKIKLKNAIMNTSFVDRGTGSPLYGDIIADVDDDIVLSGSSCHVFTAYIGDYESADIRHLEIEFELYKTDGSVFDCRPYTINIGDPDQQTGEPNELIYRNNIYRITAEVSTYGNVIAEILDWDTNRVITRKLSEFDQNVTATVAPWENVRFSDSLASFMDFWSNYRFNVTGPVNAWGKYTQYDEMTGFN